MQQSRFLESKTKFSFNNHRAQTASNFKEDSFARWSNNNFYRTSYNDMSVKVCLTSQAMAVFTSN